MTRGLKISLAIVIALLILTALANPDFVYGFAMYAATPVTPPVEFVWVLPAYCVLFILVNTLFKHNFAYQSWGRSAWISVKFFLYFVGSFFMIGLFAVNWSAGPGLPCHTFWGIGWREAGSRFVCWNLCALLLLGGWALVYLKPWRTDDRYRWNIFTLNLVIYCLCLAPYVFAGSWLHGFACRDVRVDCEERLNLLNTALCGYAAKHDGCFPEADNMESLLRELKQYFPPARIRYSAPVDVCPVGNAFERQPKHFVWDASLSGVSLLDVDLEIFVEDVLPILCPYHENQKYFVGKYLKERILEMKQKMIQNEAVEVSSK